MITASTYHKRLLYDSRDKLERLTDEIFCWAERMEWKLQAWAVFPNHYHLVGFNGRLDADPRKLAKAIHGKSAIWLNKLDGAPGRMVWYRAWDTLLTYERSYLARLNSVHENPVRHGLVSWASDYPWCSAKWFEDGADRPFYETVKSFAIDQLNVYDDFETGSMDDLD